jgi:hypothetical protein
MTNLLNNPMFYKVGFVVAVILLIGAHKLSIEGMIE